MRGNLREVAEAAFTRYLESKRETFELGTVELQVEVPNSKKEAQWNWASCHMLAKCIAPFCPLCLFTYCLPNSHQMTHCASNRKSLRRPSSSLAYLFTGLTPV